MELYTIEIKKYRDIFFQTLVPKLVAVIATAILVNKGVYLLYGFDPGKKLTLPILLVMAVLAGFHSHYQKKKLAAVQLIDNFGERVEAHQKFYKFRLLWFLFSCLIGCMISLLTGRNLFLYFAIFDIVVALPFYPSLLLFKRELNNEQIMVV